MTETCKSSQIKRVYILTLESRFLSKRPPRGSRYILGLWLIFPLTLRLSLFGRRECFLLESSGRSRVILSVVIFKNALE
jgi:hypothetical protein